MSRLAVITAIAAAIPVLAIAQAKPKVEFEVAAIRAIAPTEGRAEVGMHIDGAQVRFSFLSVRECMSIAWQMKDFQIVGPDWIAQDRFSITAKLPEGASQDQIREMLQNLLIERFKITVHREKKEFAVYALAPGKNGVKMKETAPDAQADTAPAKNLNITASGSAAGVYVDMGHGSFYSFADNKFIGHKLSPPILADQLGRYMDKPVVDMTGLPETKNYDLTLEITPDDYRVMLIRTGLKAGVSLPPQVAAMADGSTESLYTALDLAGLKLDPRKAPLDVLVVDSANKTPTEN